MSYVGLVRDLILVPSPKRRPLVIISTVKMLLYSSFTLRRLRRMDSNPEMRKRNMRRVRGREKRARVTVQARRVRWCQLRHRLREILCWRWRPPRTTGELFGSGSITGFDGFEIENCPAQTIAIVEKVIIATSNLDAITFFLAFE
jgi:hypothetical protein